MPQSNETDLLSHVVKIANETYMLGLSMDPAYEGVTAERMKLSLAGRPEPLLVEVKRWANHIDTDLLLIKLARKSPLQDLILIAQYINPKMAERFKDAGLQFLDAAGNIYLRQPGKYLFVKGNKEGDFGYDENQPSSGMKTLSAKALVVMYVILKERDALTWSYRMFSEKTSVSLGTISQVMRELEQQGYIASSATGGKTLLQRGELLQRWVSGYIEIWRKYRRNERWVSNEPFWHDEQQLNSLNVVIGGELAATHYLHYLNPGSAMFYASKQEVDDMARTFRLLKARTDFEPGYRISFMEPMMPKALLLGDDGYAHPLLVYAELIASKDPRNIETAKRLYDKYFGY